MHSLVWTWISISRVDNRVKISFLNIVAVAFITINPTQSSYLQYKLDKNTPLAEFALLHWFGICFRHWHMIQFECLGKVASSLLLAFRPFHCHLSERHIAWGIWVKTVTGVETRKIYCHQSLFFLVVTATVQKGITHGDKIVITIYAAFDIFWHLSLGPGTPNQERAEAFVLKHWLVYVMFSFFTKCKK